MGSKELERRISELERDLEHAERLASVGLTTAGLAHTIKSILGGLEGGIYVVDSGLESGDEERVRHGWEMVRGYIEQVGALVGNLLSYAKEGGERRDRVDPRSIVEHASRLFSSTAELVGIELEGSVEEGSEPLMLDEEAIRGCLANLVSNAIDACSWDPDTEKRHQIRVSCAPRPGGGVILEVKDNGKGIAEEDRCKVLTTFFTSKGVRGTGLGLLLTKKVVQEHGGSISFTTEQGKGTAFRISLPDRPPAD